MLYTENMAKFCSECGESVMQNDSFCTACGEKLRKIQSKDAEHSTDTESINSRNESIKQRAVSLNEAVRLAFANYSNFKTRSSRSEYWYFLLFQFIIIATLYFVIFVVDALGSSNVITTNMADLIGGLASIIYVCFWLAVLIPAVAVSIRRIHDIGNSAWVLLFSFIPIVGPFILLSLLLAGSEEHHNKYGPVPQQIMD